MADRGEPGGQPEFTGGRNIAMKVPPHLWEETVAFYRDLLGMRVGFRPELGVACLVVVS